MPVTFVEQAEKSPKPIHLDALYSTALKGVGTTHVGTKASAYILPLSGQAIIFSKNLGISLFRTASSRRPKMNKTALVYPVILSLVAVTLFENTRPVAMARTFSRRSMPVTASLTRTDFRHFPKLVKQLARHNDKVSAYLWSHFSPETQRLLSSYTPATSPLKLQNDLVADLNAVLHSPDFYSPDRFSSMRTRGTTRRLLAKQPSGAAVVFLNRGLLENAYPGKIMVSIAGKIFEDDADAAQADADNAQVQADADQSQAEQDQAQSDQQQADQVQADQSQGQADQAQGQVDQVAQDTVDQNATATSAQGGFTWGEFFVSIGLGLIGGALFGATAGGIVGAVVGGIVGAAAGALAGLGVTVAFGTVPQMGPGGVAQFSVGGLIASIGSGLAVGAFTGFSVGGFAGAIVGGIAGAAVGAAAYMGIKSAGASMAAAGLQALPQMALD
jgi:hypothetical protein